VFLLGRVAVKGVKDGARRYALLPEVRILSTSVFLRIGKIKPASVGTRGVVAHERRAGITYVREGHVGTGKGSRVQAGEHVLSAAPCIVVESAEPREVGRVASNKAPSVIEPP